MKKDKCKIDMKISEHKDGIRIKINTEGNCSDFDRSEIIRKFKSDEEV